MKKALISYSLSFIMVGLMLIFFPPLLPNAGKCKYAHISIDDVSDCMQRLTIDSTDAHSIFDDPFLRDLYNIHTATGCKFTLNLFVESGNWNLTEFPIKYKREFEANVSWLKFAYHGMHGGSHCDTSYVDFKQGYETFLESVSRFAGSKSIAKMTRFDYYYGGGGEVDLFRKAGGKVLFTADDKRNSYNLTSGQNIFIQEHNSLTFKGLKYQRTNIRIENIRSPYLALLNNDKRDTVVIFTHEWKWSMRNKFQMWRISKLLQLNGYRFIAE